MSEDEIDYLLQNDIQLVLKDLVKNLPWFIKLDSERQEVLMNMCYNLGWPRLSLFKTTLSLIEQGLYKDASISMLTSLWAKQVGQRAVRLAKQMETGVSLLS